MLADVQEMPEALREFVAARNHVRRMFDDYRARFVTAWTPAPMPAGWNEPPARRVVGR
jgi:hypothetical protein